MYAAPTVVREHASVFWAVVDGGTHISRVTFAILSITEQLRREFEIEARPDHAGHRRKVSLAYPVRGLGQHQGYSHLAECLPSKASSPIYGSIGMHGDWSTPGRPPMSNYCSPTLKKSNNMS